MTLRLVRAASTDVLWRTFAGRFLEEIGDRRGPDGYPSFAWLTHRLQRDRLWKEAAARRLRGWLAPPHAFFSEFPRAFGIDRRRIGLLERTVLLDGLVTEAAAGTGFTAGGIAGSFDRPGIGRAVDLLLSDLLPEGIGADRLADALDRLPDLDALALARNRWVSAVYGGYLAALERRHAYDPRSIHDLVADRIAAGGLRPAIRGATRLHVYGVTTMRARRRLLEALALVPDVDVALYVGESLAAELAGITEQVESIGDGPPPAPSVQPAPDQEREIEFVALEIKKLVAEPRVSVDEIAVVARIGREDVRFAHEALERAGIPTTARIRTPLAEVPALVAILQLLRAAALGWRYRPLRHVLESSYFKLDVDLRPIDHVAERRRVDGLEGWRERLRELLARVEQGTDDDPDLRQFRAERLARTVGAFEAFAERADGLQALRPLPEWITLTRQLLDPGWFDFRRRVCRPDGDRYDPVRLDQQGIDGADELLYQWGGTAAAEAPLSPLEWYQRLRRLLGATEVTLSTPRRTGVQVVEAHEAALIPFRRTFLIHANEGQFPRTAAPGWLFNEDERAALARLGLPMTHRDASLARERLLWESVTAGPDVTITYRTADPSGVPLLPSLLVPDHDVSTEIPRTRFVWDQPFTRHLAERADVERLRRAVAGPGLQPAVKTFGADAVRLAVLRAVAESRRLGHAASGRRAGDPGPWTGLLRDPGVLAHLAERFGPDRLWSASQLESWAQNPFVFLVERVLYLEEKIEAEEETTFLVRGSVGHSLLERFFLATKDALPGCVAEVEAEFERLADEVFAEYERNPSYWLGLPHLWRIRKARLRKMVRDYLDWELGRLPPWRPEAFELVFGEDEAQPVVIRGPTVLGPEAAIRLRGKIDRIDRRGGGPAAEHRVIDYKSGGTPPAKGYRDGAVLQGPLYLAALHALGRRVVSAEYRSIKERKAAASIDWLEEACRLALRVGLTIPSLVRQGRFEPQAAASTDWKDYWPGGLALFRAKSVLDGSRFE